MRILLVIPHVYNPTKGGKYGSTDANAAPRISAFQTCLSSLFHLFGGGIYELDFLNQRAVAVASQSIHELNVRVVTTRGLHLLERINVPKGAIHHIELDIEPMMVEFECQRILAESLGQYDLYCFLEDDLVIRDTAFFQKLEWFSHRFGDSCLLQANRYELGQWGTRVQKAYIDGNVKSTAKYQDVTDRPELVAEYLDRVVRFERPTNPHAGSYFLNASQMKCWVAQPHFLDCDTSWVGPLESAATLGIMRTFRLYKAAPPNRELFEIQHVDARYLETLGKTFPLPGTTWHDKLRSFWT